MAERKRSGPKKDSNRKNYWETMNMDNRLDTIVGWAKNGSTNNEMAEMLGISRDLFYNWQKQKPQFKAALMKGKFDSNGEMLNAAFKQATGYYQQVTEPFKVKTMKEFKTEGGKVYFEEVEEIVDHTYFKFFPPNSTMGIFMLKNRIPGEYKDKQDVNVSGDLGINIQVDYGDDE